MTPHRVEMLIAGLLFGSAIGILLGLLSDYGWSLTLHSIRLNSDIFINQYLGKVLLLCTSACLYTGYRLIILFRTQHGVKQT